MDRHDDTLREALRNHRAENGFPPDGGVGETWAPVRVGPIPICIPNVAARRRAIPFHDLNHLLTGYGHDDVGEAEIGAFELGSGCKGFVAAWILNWAALLLGVGRAPARVFAAFVRGRHTTNLYATDLDTVLDVPVVLVRSSLGLDVEYRGRLRDLALFSAAVGLAPLVGAIPGIVALLTSPFWLARGAQRVHRAV